MKPCYFSGENTHCEKLDLSCGVRDEVEYLIHYFTSSIYLYSCYMGIGGKYCEIPDKAEENYLCLNVISAPHFNDRPLRNDLIYMIYFKRVSHHGNNKEQNRPNTVVPSMKIPAFHL